jgi:hypothetical protein
VLANHRLAEDRGARDRLLPGGRPTPSALFKKATPAVCWHPFHKVKLSPLPTPSAARSCVLPVWYLSRSSEATRHRAWRRRTGSATPFVCDRLTLRWFGQQPAHALQGRILLTERCARAQRAVFVCRVWNCNSRRHEDEVNQQACWRVGSAVSVFLQDVSRLGGPATPLGYRSVAIDPECGQGSMRSAAWMVIASDALRCRCA